MSQDIQVKANPKWRNSLREHFQAIPMAERDAFADRCGTTAGHISGVSYGKYCNIELAVALHRETGGKVSMQEMYPTIDWEYVKDQLLDAETVKLIIAKQKQSVTITRRNAPLEAL